MGEEVKLGLSTPSLLLDDLYVNPAAPGSGTGNGGGGSDGKRDDEEEEEKVTVAATTTTTKRMHERILQI